MTALSQISAEIEYASAQLTAITGKMKKQDIKSIDVRYYSTMIKALKALSNFSSECSQAYLDKHLPKP
ncbi:MAG: hypothetical protein MK006_14010 [Pirellulales bacterium]|nr:hypothetical protein [Pirellulales bacterium]